jgi:hypothetical protein
MKLLKLKKISSRKSMKLRKLPDWISRHHETLFGAVALKHAKSLSLDYLNEIRFSGHSKPDGLLSKVTPSTRLYQWSKKSVSSSGMMISEYQDCFKFEVIGHIDKDPVLFSKQTGIYIFQPKDYAGTFDLWLTHPYYPRGW